VKRALAVVGAVVMIAVAVVVRSAIDDGKSSGGTTSSAESSTIVCVTELAEQCRALTGGDVRIEDAAVTAKAIAAGKEDADAWVTLDPWPAIVDQLAGGDVMGSPSRVARTDLVIAMVEERAARLAPTCGGTVTWKCLGDDIGHAWTEFGGDPLWGAIKAGIPPVSSAEGLVLLGDAASGYFGRSTFATNDFDDAFLVWKSKVTATPADLATFILKFPAAFSAVGTTRTDVVRGSGAKPVTIIDAPPPAHAVAVIASVDGRRIPGFANGLKDRLVNAGWTTDRLDDPTGLPDAGVLLALSWLTG
jgi:hypothetical protein